MQKFQAKHILMNYQTWIILFNESFNHNFEDARILTKKKTGWQKQKIKTERTRNKMKHIKNVAIMQVCKNIKVEPNNK